ncbi:hypothetical protein A1O7_08030 [Cladophialophora yegresii CBS 114405]|uniref:Uncharacterized protein n=1 Tax=Cladophialophora yegresii CBS 114405 TaxID=1182544 RepID=W9VQ18_9EURO|nr:uncharacterized protein A1O7_08030 [Cladophialophora yegresii CBS 114405]EXJ55105.1 hypothetical protein A1O7_08030 [Cladophialophora yegresii CBS 114405]
MMLLVLLTVLSGLVIQSLSQNSCGTDQNPYCAGNSIFEQLCCPYPNVCYWQNRDGTPGCCPAGQVCDGSSPYSPSTPKPSLTSTIRATTIQPSTITITSTPTPAPTTAGGGGVIIISTVPNSPSIITVTVTTITTHNPCGGAVCSTITSAGGGVYSTVTSVVGGGFSTVTSGAASVFSSVSGVLVGQPSATPRSAIASIVMVVLAVSIAVIWSTFG